MHARVAHEELRPAHEKMARPEKARQSFSGLRDCRVQSFFFAEALTGAQMRLLVR